MSEEKIVSDKFIAEGYLYCLTSRWLPKNTFKLGYTTDLSSRLKNYATSHLDATFSLTLPECKNKDIAFCPKNNKPETKINLVIHREKALFKLLEQFRVDKDHEFFNCSFDTVKTAFAKVKSMDDLKLMAFLNNIEVGCNCGLKEEVESLEQTVVKLKAKLKAVETQRDELLVQVNTEVKRILAKTEYDKLKVMLEDLKKTKTKFLYMVSDSEDEAAETESGRVKLEPCTEPLPELSLMGKEPVSKDGSSIGFNSEIQRVNSDLTICEALPYNAPEEEEDSNKQKCVARVCKDGKPKQCGNKQLEGKDFCFKHYKDNEVCDKPCQFDDNGEKKGLFYGRIDEPIPIYAPNGMIAINWTSPLETKLEIEKVLKEKKSDWHPNSDFVKRKAAAQKRKFNTFSVLFEEDQSNKKPRQDDACL